jgi:predicted DNA-binding protein (MmcQ/YjbR family)
MAARKRPPRSASLAAQLRAFGIEYPGAHLRSPWPGHLDLVVKDKTFAFLSDDSEPFGISCKLPLSGGIALTLPGARPTPYGLGKSGWVSLSAAEGAEIPPLAMLEAWIDESYRAQAPKKLVAQLDDLAAAPAPRRTRKRAASKVRTGKKSRRRT